MAQNETTQVPANAAGGDRPPEVTDVLDRVGRLLADGQAGAALASVEAAGVRSPWIENARGVCLLRLGRAAAAVEALRGLVFDPNGFAVRADAHPVHQANFATALLLDGNADGFFSILGGIRDRDDPAVARLDAAVRAWRAKRPWGGWLLSVFGLAGPPLALDFPPGAL